MLDWRGGKRAANFREQVGTRSMPVRKHAYLDQFVAAEAAVDFLQYGGSQSVVADHHYRMQGVRTGAKFAALGRSQFKCHDCAGV